VLAIETARAGAATGEATAVLRTLPGRARRRLPLRLRVNHALAIAFLVLAAAAVIAIIVFARDKTERGTRPASIKPPAGLAAINLKTGAAHDYDPPPGDGSEHGDEVSAAIDDNPSSSWSTETYRDQKLTKPGVGLYVDASPGVALRQIILKTPTPGWSGAIYAAESGPPGTIDGGWRKLADLNDVQTRQMVKLDTGGKRYPFYLVWITQLPPGKSKVEISDLALFR